MRMIIEQTDFRRLSPETQKELLERFAGRQMAASRRTTRRADAKWTQPIDLSLPLANKLVHGLTDDEQTRLRLFARTGGRATMRELLAVTDDNDWHVLSHWQGVLTRRLRRLMGDTQKKAHLIGWDYDATHWDEDHKDIVDGVYYVTKKTSQSLRRYFAGS